jgi:hypothetical protein
MDFQPWQQQRKGGREHKKDFFSSLFHFLLCKRAREKRSWFLA